MVAICLQRDSNTEQSQTNFRYTGDSERMKEGAKMQLEEFDYFFLSATYVIARPYLLQHL
jgi:hypothetical protein